LRGIFYFKKYFASGIPDLFSFKIKGSLSPQAVRIRVNVKLVYYMIIKKLINHLKGQCHEIFDPRFYSSNNPPYGLDLWAKAVLNMASNSPRKSR
jgi:hypothetical protein